MESIVNDFTCLKCGNCCTVKGTVRLAPGEADKIAAHLGIGVETFTSEYTELSMDRRSLILKDKLDGSCIFLQEDRMCLINKSKPGQCLGFPAHWRYEGWEKVCASRYASAGGLNTKEIK